MRISAESKAIIAIMAAALSLGGCEKKEAPASGTAQSSTSLSEDAQARIQRVLAAYETIRDQLARDDVAATTGSAGALAQAAKDAVSAAPASLRSQLGKLAEASSQLQQMPKTDASAVRRTFGQVSEALITLISGEPSLRKGQHVFECPMAQGYKKWVQPTERIANPYMGTQMLECGSPSKWEGT
jgi:uncharacterized lipoprotein NlpE involved in copper resistance